jgi:hypothetical protein
MRGKQEATTIHSMSGETGVTVFVHHEGSTFYALQAGDRECEVCDWSRATWFLFPTIMTKQSLARTAIFFQPEPIFFVNKAADCHHNKVGSGEGRLSHGKIIFFLLGNECGQIDNSVAGIA